MFDFTSQLKSTIGRLKAPPMHRMPSGARLFTSLNWSLLAPVGRGDPRVREQSCAGPSLEEAAWWEEVGRQAAFRVCRMAKSGPKADLVGREPQ